MNSPIHSPLRIAFRPTSSLALLVGFSALAIASPRAEPVPVQPPGGQPSTPDAPMPSRPAEDFKNQSPSAEKKADRATTRVLMEVAALSTESTRLSQVATRRAAHAEVRDFAGQVKNASQALLEEVDRIAATKNVSVRPDSEEGDAAWDPQSGPAFDESYLRRTRRLHEDAIVALEDYVGHGDADPQIAALAEQHLPGLHQHLRQAENLDERVSRNPAPPREDLIAAGERSPNSSSLRRPPVILAFHEEATE